MNVTPESPNHAVTIHAAAYVRNLVAAEQAVRRGEFNVAKIMRAAATAQRTIAMNAARFLPEQTGADTLQAVRQEVTTPMLGADGENEAQREMLRRSGVVQTQLAELLERALASLAGNPDVLERDVDQFINVCLICGSTVEGAAPHACSVCGALSSEFDRFGPFYGATAERLGQLTPAQVIEQLSKGPDRVAELVIGVDDDLLTRKPSPEEWSIKEIIGHLAETDRLFVRRVRSILDDTPYRQTTPPWKTHEGKGYETMPIDDLLSTFRAVRSETMTLIEPLSPQQWATTGPMLGETRSLLDIGTWHGNHDPAHIAQIRRMIEMLD